jgi:hypothetical protein
MDILSHTEKFLIKKSDSTILIVIFGTVYLISQMIIGSIIYPLGTLDALRLQTTMSSDTFKAIASGWIASGQIRLYYDHFRLDNLHPLWYSIFLSLVIARTFKINHMNPKFNFIILTPFVAAICDYFENMMHLYFLADLNRATPVWVACSGLATNIKWALAGLGVVTIIIMMMIWFVDTFMRKRQ